MTKHLDVNLINGIALALRKCCLFLVHSPSPDFQGQDQAKSIAPSSYTLCVGKGAASLEGKMLEQRALTEKG